MNNKNFKNNHNESLMEDIYGCLVRIEPAGIELQIVQPSEGNSVVNDEVRVALVIGAQS